MAEPGPVAAVQRPDAPLMVGADLAQHLRSPSLAALSADPRRRPAEDDAAAEFGRVGGEVVNAEPARHRQRYGRDFPHGAGQLAERVAELRRV